MPVTSPQRARDEIVRNAHRHLDVSGFARAAARAVGRAVPFDGVCVLTFDPATLLPTGEIAENGLPSATRGRLTEIELGEPDFNKFDALVHAPRPVASLSDATEGHLDRSLRQRELRRPSGFGDELRAVLVSDSQAWGALTLLRERGRPHFTESEVRRVDSLAAPFAEGLRRALAFGELASDDGTGVGLVLLADDNSIEHANAVARDLIDELGPDGAGVGHVPIVVQAVATRVRRLAASKAPDGFARARVRTRSGRWLVADGSLVGAGPDAAVAVVLQPAAPAQVAPLIAAAYGLSERERDVTQLVAQGFSTGDIARRLHLSPWTVQDHLKAIFTKTGTGTRRELVARLFFDHYAARLSP